MKTKLTPSLRRHLASPRGVVVLLVVVAGAILLPLSHADTSTYPAATHAASYSCNSGDTLSGTSCKHTYAATATHYYYCTSGTLKGSTCTTTSTGTAKLVCNSGDSYNSSTAECSHYDGKAGGIHANTCPSGETASFGNCYTYYKRKTVYVCPNGTQQSSPTCYTTTNAQVGTKYTCNSGDTRTNNTCTNTYPATYHPATYSCNSGDTLSGTTCTHTTSGSGGGTPRTHKSSGSSSGGSTAVAPTLPAAPTSFIAILRSDKVVDLSWTASTASAGIQDYIINRSTDNVNWEPLTTITDTSYEDDATDFNTTYYYQIEAVDNSGNVSDYATTQITTNTFSSTSNNLTSDDKLVTISIPSNTFDQQADCTIGSSSGNSSSQPAGKSIIVLGPYDLLCIGTDGSVLDSFSQPLKATINLSKASVGFKDFSVRTINGTTTKAITSSYNAKTKKISFQLTGDDSFAVYAVRAKGAGGTIVGVILALLLLAILVAGFLFLRRRMLAGGNPAIPAAGSVPGVPSAAEQFEQAVNKPNCTHLAMAHQVLPQSEGCQECIAAGRQWKSLRICLTCGHVGCSDDSEGQDARKHFEQTGHPLIMAYNEPAAGNIGWCYIDQTYI